MKGRISKPGEAYLHYHSSYLYSWLVHLTGTQHINEASISTNAAFPLLSPPGTTRKTMFDTLWQQRYLMGRLGGKKAGCELVKNICIVGGRLSDSRYWVWTRMSVGGNKGLSCSANLPRMCKDHINQCCCPSHSPIAVSSLSTAQLSCRFHVSDLCCCCFLLWAQFYTVCQSPERHTLEGPVEWDTKSDPSGEQLFSHLPPPPISVCLSLSSSLSLPLSL